FGAQAELAGANLRERGTQSLPDRGGSGEHRHAPGVRHAHQSGFERRAPGALDAMGKADAEIAALLARSSLAPGKVVPARRLQDLALTRRIVAAVILHDGAGARLERLGVGHFLRRDKVAAAHLGAIEAEFARDAVHQPLPRK